MYLVGYVLKPQGIRGELKIESVSPDPERFKDLDYIYIKNKDVLQTYQIRTVRIADRFVYLKFYKITSRDEAEELRGAEVLIDEEDLVQPSEDEYFIHDLIGCRVISEQNDCIGTVSDVMQMPGNDILVVINDDKQEILLPVIKSVVKKVDIAQKRISIHLIEGLID